MVDIVLLVLYGCAGCSLKLIITLVAFRYSDRDRQRERRDRDGRDERGRDTKRSYFEKPIDEVSRSQQRNSPTSMRALHKSILVLYLYVCIK